MIKKDGTDYFFAGWKIDRRYTAEEFEKAELFLLHHISTFEPAGEECGTQYDESMACKRCKAGASQITPLFLDWKRIPKSKDIARTIAGEIVVSARLVELFKQHIITGTKFLPIRHRPASSAESKDWFQFVADSSDALIVAPTKTGINPFDEDVSGEYRCPMKDKIVKGSVLIFSAQISMQQDSARFPFACRWRCRSTPAIDSRPSGIASKTF